MALNFPIQLTDATWNPVRDRVKDQPESLRTLLSSLTFQSG